MKRKMSEERKVELQKEALEKKILSDMPMDEMFHSNDTDELTDDIIENLVENYRSRIEKYQRKLDTIKLYSELIDQSVRISKENELDELAESVGKEEKTSKKKYNKERMKKSETKKKINDGKKIGKWNRVCVYEPITKIILNLLRNDNNKIRTSDVTEKVESRLDVEDKSHKVITSHTSAHLSYCVEEKWLKKEKKGLYSRGRHFDSGIKELDMTNDDYDLEKDLKEQRSVIEGCMN